MHRNITDNHSKQIEIERLRFALAAAGIGTWDLDPLRNLIVWDEQCRELFGFAPDEEVAYEQVLKHVHPEDVDTVHQAVQKALDPATDGEYEVRYRTISAADRKIRWLLSKGKAYLNKEGIAYRFAGSAQDITASVLEHEKVIASEKMAQVALENSASGYFHISLASNSMEYSPGYLKIMTGDERKKVENHTDFINYLHPDDRRIRAKAHEIALQTGKLAYEARIVWDDGSIHWIRVKGTYLNDATGKPYLLTGTVYEITAEKKAREEIAAAQQLADLAIESSGLGLFRVDLINDEVDYSPVFARIMTGNADKQRYKRADFLKSIHPGDRAQQDEAIKTGLQTGSFSYECRVVWDNGSVHRIRITGSTVYNEAGDAMALAGTARDMTEREKQAQALKQSEAKFRLLVEEAPVATCLLVGPEMKIEIANEIMVGYWGKDKTVIGQPLEKAVPELKGQPFFDILDQVFTTGKTYEAKAACAELEKEGVLSTYYFDFTYKPLFDASGEIYGILNMAVDVTEQVLASQKLKESELFAKSIIDNSPVAKLVFLGENMIINTVNQNMLAMLGRTESIIGLPFMEAMPELIDTPLMDRLRQVFTTGETYHQPEEKLILEKNGERQAGYYNYIYKALRNTSGRIYGIIVTATDVTDQVQARLNLEASEARLRSLVESAPFPIGVYTGREMRIRLANQSILDAWGKGADVIGKTYSEVLPELANQEIYEQLDSVFSTGVPVHKRNQRVDLEIDGQLQPFYFNYSFTPLYDAAGAIYGVMNTAADVTDLVLAKLQVEQAEISLRGAVELAELSTWSLDIEKNVFTYSERFMEWLGFSENTKDLDAVYNSLPEEYRQQVPDAIAKAIQPGSSGIYENEHPVINRVTGQVRIIHAQGQVFYNALGKPVMLSGTAQDITEQRKLQQALEQQVQERTEELAAANEELQAVNEELAATNEELSESNNRLVRSNEELAQYAYVASHDLQEPLRKIQMFSGMLQGGSGLPEESSQLVNKIHKASERMTLLIRDLLEFSRLLKAEKLMQPVDLNTIFDAVLGDFELIIMERGAAVHRNGLPVIEGVSLQLNQLFYNLLSNALKFTRPGVPPRIEVTCQPITESEAAPYIQKPATEGQYYHIRFSDNGIGFEDKYSEQIFEVFKRLHGRDLYPGSGIGLALCRRIVANHGGHLYADSEPGKGTTFHIILHSRI